MNPLNLNYLCSVNYKNKAFTFGAQSSENGDYNDIYYSFLDSQASGTREADWSVFRKLSFPTMIEPAGIRLGAVTVDGLDAKGNPNTSSVFTADKPFVVVADNNYIFIFRASSRNSVLVDRFIYDASIQSLVNVNEIRYIRSGSPDVPDSRLDSFGAYDPLGNAFVEPTTEFYINSDTSEDSFSFDVLEIPSAKTSYTSVWQIITGIDNEINIYSISRTEFVLFDMMSLESYAANTVDEDGRYILGASLSLQLPSPVTNLAATVYFDQEKILNSSGNYTSVKRGGNVMITATEHGTSEQIILDLEVNSNGMLAGMTAQNESEEDQTNYSVAVQEMQSYGTVIEFDGNKDFVQWGGGTDYITGTENARPGSPVHAPGDIPSQGLAVELWTKFTGDWSREFTKTIWSIKCNLVLSEESVSMGSVSLVYTNSGRLSLQFWDEGKEFLGEVLFSGAPSVTPESWHHLILVYPIISPSSTYQLIINGCQISVDASPDIPVIEGPDTGDFTFYLGKDKYAINTNLEGRCSELRVWENSQQDLIDNLMTSRNLPVTEIPTMYQAYLLLCEAFNEGIHAYDDEYNEAFIESYAIPDLTDQLYKAIIYGASWVSDIIPSRINMEVQYVDANVLACRSCKLSSEAGDMIDATVKPAFLDASDGITRLYYTRQDKHIGVVHYNAAVQRKQVLLYWNAFRDNTLESPLNTEVANESLILPKLIFTSKIVGDRGNSCTVSISEDPKSYVDLTASENEDTVVLDDTPYLKVGLQYSDFPTKDGFGTFLEEYFKIPYEVNKLVQIINGEAISSHVENLDKDQVIYDYSLHLDRRLNGNRIHLSENPDTTEYASFLFQADELSSSEEEIVQSFPEDFNTLVTTGQIYGCDATWAGTPVNSILTFNGGMNNYVDVPVGDHLDINEKLCLESWFKPVETDRQNEFLCYTNGKAKYAVGLTGENKVYLAFANDEINANQCYAETSNALDLDEDDPRWAALSANYTSGYALNLSNDAYVNIPNSESLNPDRQLSIEAWCFPDNISGKNQIIASKWGEEALEKSWRLYISASGNLAFEIIDAEKDIYQIVSNSSLVEGWNHVAASYAVSHLRTMMRINEHTSDVDFELPGIMDTWTNEVTFECWVMTDDNDEDDNFCIVSSYYTDKSEHAPLIIRYNPSRQLMIQVGRRQWMFRDYQLTDGKLHHIAVSLKYDTTIDKTLIAVYLDGETILDTIQDGRLNTNDDFDFWILGAILNPEDTDDHREHFSGYLSDVRMWTTARTQRQIVDYMNVAVPDDAPGLVGNFTMNQFFNTDTEANEESEELVDQDKYIVNSVTDEKYYANTHNQDAISWVKVEIGKKFNLYLNGSLLNENDDVTCSKNGSDISLENMTFPGLQKSEADLILGRKLYGNIHSYTGLLDNVRLWSNLRLPAQLDFYRYNNLELGFRDESEKMAYEPLISAWTFDKQEANKVLDTTGENKGTIEGISIPDNDTLEDNLKVFLPATFNAEWELWIDGTVKSIVYQTNRPYPFTGGSYLTFAKYVNGSQHTYANLNLAELRIWNKSRSEEEINGDKNTALAGTEANLMGYWRLNDGSGSLIRDTSVYRQDGLYMDVGFSHGNPWHYPVPAHDDYPVPVNNDTLLSVNKSTNSYFRSAKKLQIQGQIGVAQYNNLTQTAYSYTELIDDEAPVLQLLKEASVSDFELVYIGQAQYDPKIVGFIEGAPPVPSENLTVDTAGNPDKYVGTAKVNFVQQGEVTTTLSSDLQGTFNYEQAVNFSSDAEADTKINIGPVIGTASLLTLGLEAELAFGLDEKFGVTGAHEESNQSQSGTNNNYELMLGGAWKPNIYNFANVSADKLYIQAPRLYRPNNMGMAVVKSRTADIYAMQHKNTGATLGYQYVLDPNIPEDSNLLMFKLNPRYVKNGSLDGRIGFDTDTAYPDLADDPQAKASFFKAEEAYQLQHQIEREQEAFKNKKVQSGEAGNLSDLLSLVDTYVWTADGGFLAEQKQFIAAHSETFSNEGKASLQFSVNADLGIKLGFGITVGASLKTDMMLGGEIVSQSASTSGAQSSFGLQTEVGGEGFLSMQADMINSDPRDLNFDSSDDYTAAVNDLNNGYPVLQNSNEQSLYSMLVEAGLITEEGGTTNKYLIVRTGNDSWSWFGSGREYIFSADYRTNRITYSKRITAHPGQYPVLYQSDNCPGKVTGYRFKTFYLRPDIDNFKLLTEGYGDENIPVIDQGWLDDDSNPDAVAMRQALGNTKKVWRIFHRVTYVSRVPPNDDIAPQFTEEDNDPQSDALWFDQAEQLFQKPDKISIASNYVIIQYILGQIGTGFNVIDQDDPDFTKVEENILHWIDLNTNALSLDEEESEKLYVLMANYFRAYLLGDE